MVFSSIEFIYIFLPLFILIYYIIPQKGRNACLFAGSMIFYAIGSAANPYHFGIFVCSIIINYVAGRMMEVSRNRKSWLIIGIAYNLVSLIVFKYTCFLADWAEGIGVFVKVPGILAVLPIGISFYTFQAISYLCDVYKRRCDAEKSFIGFGTYLSMFPQLIAGPIVKYASVKEQIDKREYTLHGFAQGLQTFILGLGSKVILANRVGALWTQLSTIGYESISTPLAWLGLLAYTFQIYFDFWGYSLMAVGLGQMLGFDLPQNFNNPYRATSMTEFWRRWHMTLGSWFREYVYIPLGGNRGGRWKVFRNLFIVWILTGIWHGAGWNFVLWGLLLFICIAIEKAGLKKWLDKYRILGHVYMAVTVPLTWAVFANTEWTRLTSFFQRLFAWGEAGGPIFSGDYVKYGLEYGVFLLLCGIFIVGIPQKIYAKIKNTYVGHIILAVIFVIAAYYLYMGLDDPFLYYQF